MRPMTRDATRDEGHRCKALRCLGEQAMAKQGHIWEELEAQGIHLTPGVIYQAISRCNWRPKTVDEDEGAETMMGKGKGISLRDVERVLSIAEKAGGVRRLMRLLRRVEQVPR
jgi:hypothetical protein